MTSSGRPLFINRNPFIGLITWTKRFYRSMINDYLEDFNLLAQKSLWFRYVLLCDALYSDSSLRLLRNRSWDHQRPPPTNHLTLFRGNSQCCASCTANDPQIGSPHWISSWWLRQETDEPKESQKQDLMLTLRRRPLNTTANAPWPIKSFLLYS